VTHPDDDALAAIALGDPAPSGAAEHVRSCPQCSETLAALRDTMTTLHAPVPELVAPPASVWDAVTAEVDREPDEAPPAPAPEEGVAMETTRAPEVAPASIVDAGDDLARQRAGRAARRRFPVAWVAGAAAAGLVVGAVGARVLAGEQTPAPVTVMSTSLDTLDTRQARGTADVVREDGRLDLAVSTQPIDAGNGYLEVWLINKDLKRMVSVGVLQPGEPAQSFAIPQALLDQGYVIVDISREGYDDSPQHSGDSVVRGTLPT
jgi:hypothetical protein